MLDKAPETWTSQDASELYDVARWGNGYFSVSPDGNLLASAGDDYTIRLWNVTTCEEVANLEDHAAAVKSVAFSPDGRTLASASGDHTVRLWDVATGQLRATLRGHSEVVNCVVFSPDGKTLASASADATIRLWRAASPEELP